MLMRGTDISGVGEYAWIMKTSLSITTNALSKHYQIKFAIVDQSCLVVISNYILGNLLGNANFACNFSK